MITKNYIENELKKVIYPGFSKSIVDFGFVKNIIVVDKFSVAIKIEITSSLEDIEKKLRDDINDVLNSIGITTIEIDIKKPQSTQQKGNSKSNKNIAPQIKNFVMISSGKGGVGKSTTTVNLAIACAMQGKKVGILDADIYGPNIPRMMGVDKQKPEIIGNKVKPLNAYGVDVMSMGSLLDEGQALIWRGAMIMKAIEQLLRDILWENLDILFIDMPPGTGDAQLTLAQSVPICAGINVTTPQHVALDDLRRSLDMFKKLNIPIAGIIENMSGFICPSCNTQSDIFDKGTCEDIAKEYDTKVLGSIPIELSIREGSDEGKPIVYFQPETISSKNYLKAAMVLWEAIMKSNEKGDVGNATIQPTNKKGCSS